MSFIIDVCVNGNSSSQVKHEELKAKAQTYQQQSQSSEIQLKRVMKEHDDVAMKAAQLHADLTAANSQLRYYSLCLVRIHNLYFSLLQQQNSALLNGRTSLQERLEQKQNSIDEIIRKHAAEIAELCKSNEQSEVFN